MDTIVNTAINWTTVTVLTMLVAAFGIGGTYWKKTKNKRQDEEIKRQEEEIEKQRRLLIKMACHQLQVSCERALENGTLTLAEYQELQEFYHYYDEIGGNGPGKKAFNKVMEQIDYKED